MYFNNVQREAVLHKSCQLVEYQTFRIGFEQSAAKMKHYIDCQLFTLEL